jgi:hypothetical protein
LGRWQARIADEHAQLVSIGTFATTFDAPNALRLAVGDQARGDWIDPQAGRITLHGYAGEWLAHRSTIRPRTRELYESLLRHHILPTLGTTTLATLTPRSIRAWHTRLGNKPKPGPVTVAKAYRLLRTILNTAVEDGAITRNPCVIKGAGGSVRRSVEAA